MTMSADKRRRIVPAPTQPSATPLPPLSELKALAERMARVEAENAKLRRQISTAGLPRKAPLDPDQIKEGMRAALRTGGKYVPVVITAVLTNPRDPADVICRYRRLDETASKEHGKQDATEFFPPELAD